MNFKIALLTLIIAVSCVFSQTTGVGYEREDLAVITQSGADLAHVELDNSYKMVGSEMYLTDCGLTTCYLNLVITPDTPLDARSIIGRVAGGSASYAGAQVYETRTVPIATYKTVQKNYTQLSNLSGKNETVFYNTTEFDRYVSTPVADWYPMGSTLSGVRYVRLEFHKADQRETVDLIPEIAGQRISGWAYWVGTEQIPYWTDGSDGIWINVSLNTTQNLSILINKSMGSDTGNGSKVFYCFDTFSSASIDTDMWTENDGSATIAGNIIDGYFNVSFSTATAGYALVCDRNIPANDFVIEWRGYYAGGGLSGSDPGYIGIPFGNGSIYFYGGNEYYVPTFNYGYSPWQHIPSNHFIGEATNNAITSLSGGTSTYVSDGAWQNHSVYYYSNGTIRWLVDGAYTMVATDTSNLNIDKKMAFTKGYYNTNPSIMRLDNITVRKISTTPPTVSCADLSATQVLCNISTTVNLTGYQVRIPYTSVNDTNLTVELAEEVLNEAPVLQSISLFPTTLYKNMTVACAVNWTHPTNSTFTVYQGLARNGTILDTFNQTYDNYPNGTIWNYTSYPLSVEFTHGDNVSCWSRANTTDANSTYNYTANYTIGNWAPIISNVQISNPIQNGSNATGTADFTDVEGDTINCWWLWYVNGTNVWNETQAPCANASTLDALNYTTGNLINFTVYANDSYGDNSTPAYSATVEVTPPFTWNNYTYTATQYESVYYSYTLNFTIPAGDENGTAQLEYNGLNISASCSNISTTYYCTLSNIPAPLVSTNGTAKNGNWYVSYDSLTAGATTVNQSFAQTVYYGVWATGINSSTLVAGGGPASVNVLYANTSGITATLSGTAWFLTATSSSGALTCTAGVCSGSITTPSVSTATLYQVEANITLTSSYWGTTQNRVVRLESSGTLTAADAQVSYSGTITNPTNANDSNWGTYATYSVTGAYHIFNYSTTSIYGLVHLRTRFYNTYANTTVPQECWGTAVSFKVLRDSTLFRVYCWNYSSEGYSLIYSMTPAAYYFYEQNVSYAINNSYVKVVPFGFTNCTTGVPFLNYTCWNELDGSSETCDYEQTFVLNTTSGDLIQTFTGSAHAWQICFYPSALTGNVSSIEEIGGAGFDTRFFYIFTTPFNSSISYNETRWVGDAATTKLTFVYAKRAGVGEPNVYIYVQRLFIDESTFKTVGMGLTNDDGTAVIYLEPNDAFYKFVVVDGAGTVLYTSSTQQVGCASTAASCAVTLNIETSVVDFWDYQDGISSACTFSDTTKIYSCSFTVASGVSKYFQLDCYRWAQFGNKSLNCTQSTSTASGTLFCDLGDASTTGTYVCYLQSYSTGLILQEDTFNWMAVASWGTTGLFIALIIILVMAWVGTHFGPSMTILLAYVGFAVSWLFQFVNVDLLAMVGLGVVAGAMMYVIKH